MEIALALSGGWAISALEWTLATTTLSSRSVKLAALAAFSVNFLAVSIPGRLDGQVAEAMQNADMGRGSDARDVLLPALGKSYITPAGWAFVIWAPIYLGEIIMTLIIVFLKFNGPAGDIVRAFLPCWVSANLFQSMWCYAFRPIFHTDSAKESLGPFVSALFLGLTALSLAKVHIVTSKKSSSCSLMKQAMFVPLTMHFGWTTAATLVNISGALANYSDTDTGSAANLFSLACASILAALMACVAMAGKTRSPTYAFVIGWALLAVSDGMNARMKTSTDVEVLAHARSIHILSYLASIASIFVGVVLLAASLCCAASSAVAVNERRAAVGTGNKPTNSFLIDDSQRS